MVATTSRGDGFTDRCHTWSELRRRIRLLNFATYSPYDSHLAFAAAADNGRNAVQQPTRRRDYGVAARLTGPPPRSSPSRNECPAPPRRGAICHPPHPRTHPV